MRTCSRGKTAVLTIRKLVINADDFGLSSGINDAAIKLADAGRLTGVSILTHHADVSDVSRLRSLPFNLDVGVHFCFTLRPFASSDCEIPSFLDQDGQPLKPSARFLEHARYEEVELEMERQLESALDWDIPLTHIDSHHHVHRRTDLMELFCNVARRHSLAVRTIDDETRSIARRAGIRTADNFLMGFYGEGATLDQLRELLSGLQPGTTELMAHPSLPDSRLGAVSGYVDGRYREYEVLSSDELGEFLKENGIQIVGWREV